MKSQYHLGLGLGLALAGLLVSSVVCSAATYYVATNGLDSRTGLGNWTNAVLTMLMAARDLGATGGELVQYLTRGETSEDFTRVNGYAGMLIK